MRLSIVTIALENPEGLNKTIDSLLPLAETLPDQMELLIVDSSPSSHQAVRAKFAQPWIRWHDSLKEGIYPAINRGTELATGKIIWHLHSGDKMSDVDQARRALQMLENSSASVLFSDVRLERHGESQFIHRHNLDFNSNLLGGNSVHHQGVLFKRDVFERLGRFSNSYRLASDYDFFIRVADAKLATIHFRDPFVTYDTGGRSLTSWPTVLKESLSLLLARRENPFRKLRSLFSWTLYFFRLGVVSPILQRLKIYDKVRHIFYRLKNKSGEP